MSDQPRDPADLVKLLVSSLADEPDLVDVRSTEGDDALLIEVTVAEDDISKVIGRGGRVIKAIRTLTRASASIDGIDRVDVEIIS